MTCATPTLCARRRLTDRQISVAYHYLTRTDDDVIGGMGMATYGGKVNTVAPEATASARRESILTMSCSTAWANPQDEARSLAWVRQFYQDLFSDTGDVPVPGEQCQGALINHPDVVLADPQWNTSGVPWQRWCIGNRRCNRIVTPPYSGLI